MDSLSGKRFHEAGELVPSKRATRQIKLSANKAKANITATASPDELTTLWDRDFSVYRTCIVKVVGRSGSVIRFNLIDGNNVEVSNRGTPFSVDLDDGKMVWGDLPSTAQLAKPGSKKAFGFLLLTEKWRQENASWWQEWFGGGGGGTGPKVPKLSSL